ncbi:hypothetical protein PMAYCL1PPCAC_10031 [Pristionchus mayeri]|uniref:Phosphatidylserine decarboxylase proenzyme, mitochondrial n=1 Tax=Pristionchus mayeri TaxID=1317129 RepID=A0AAN4ZIR2_9BILA|nr:hypothetical protein PMAYCL1PPCAC_10031 [Pristionchus mayeri]
MSLGASWIRSIAGSYRSLMSTAVSRRLQSTAFQGTVSKKSRVRLYALLASSAVIGGTGAYAARLATPDWRTIIDPAHYYEDWQIRAYFSLPLNVVSRLAGGIANREIPVSLRRPLLGLFAKMYDCRMDEAIEPDFESYSSFSAFFNRTLRPEARPISATPLVSPADGIVLHYGKIDDDKVEFVKGHDYNVKEFLGDVEIKPKAGHDLYQLVVYLAPGNYHAFHSPAKWTSEHIRHYPGLLLSVRPALLNRVPHLFCLNERVILNGSWRHGFFSMAAVAATNVGDIAIDADPSVRTNISSRRAARAESVRTECARAFAAGERVGEFRLGSTIVLIFQAPSNVKFAVQAGDALRYGQSLIVDDM